MQTTMIGMGRHNVGRIAERIVSNELEYHGFRVSDLNKEGASVNADLLAAKDGRTWQMQVKGASLKLGEDWWFNYGYCTGKTLQPQGRMFNTAGGFYRAEFVVLVAVRSPSDYCCLVLPETKAEEAAQMNIDYAFRTKLNNGEPKKPGKAWTYLDYLMNTKDPIKRAAMKEEQDLLKPFINRWDLIAASLTSEKAYS